MLMEAQAALEQAAVNMIRLTLGYRAVEVDRTFNGQPPPASPNVFVAVWYDGSRLGEWRTALFESMGLFVTVTLRVGHLPFDRLVAARDELEARCNRITELLCKDTHSNFISNAAEALAGFQTDLQPPGFVQGLRWLGYDPVELKGPDWFHADLEQADQECGLSQRIRFGDNLRIRRLQGL